MNLDFSRIVAAIEQGQLANGPAIPPPRSWKTDEKELFATLPREIQLIIERREDQREKAVRRTISIIGAAKAKLEAGDVEGALRALQKKPYEEHNEEPATAAA
jgi:hypothetical protein